MKINDDVLKEMDFSFLEGRIINVESFTLSIKGIIIGCDYNVGITVMDVNKKEYLVCLRGPSSWRKFNIPNEKKDFDEHHERFKEIIEGIINHNTYFTIKSKRNLMSSADCPFV